MKKEADQPLFYIFFIKYRVRSLSELILQVFRNRSGSQPDH